METVIVRGAELEAIEEFLEEAALGPRALVLSGEPAVLDRLSALAEQGTVLVATTSSGSTLRRPVCSRSRSVVCARSRSGSWRPSAPART